MPACRFERPIAARPTVKDMGDTAFALALDQAQRAIDQQKDDLASVRSRANSLILLGGVAASVLGGVATSDGSDIGGWAWVGVAAFVGTIVAALVVLLPWTFGLSASAAEMVGWVENRGAGSDDVARDLALRYSKARDNNEKALNRLMATYTVGVVFLVIEVVTLTWNLR